ncbi:hypothetical protein HO913_01670 [Streptococcus suis]|nr:hypothetical protein [Streptococcus suis]
MIRKIQEYFKNTNLAERVFTLIALALLVITLLIWFVGTRSNDTSSSQAVSSTKTLEANNVLAAEKAVKALEESNTDENLLSAQAAVDKLTDKSKKDALQKRIDTVATAMKKKAEDIQKAKLKAELVRAEAAKKLAEEQKKTEESSTTAESTSSTEEVIANEATTEISTEYSESYVEDTYSEDSYTYQPSYDYVEQGNSSVYTPSSSSSTTQSSSSSTTTEVVPPSSSETVVPSTPTPVEPSSSTETDVPADSSSTTTEDLSQR